MEIYEYPEEVFDKIIAINQKLYLMTQAVSRILVAKGERSNHQYVF